MRLHMLPLQGVRHRGQACQDKLLLFQVGLHRLGPGLVRAELVRHAPA